MYYLKRFIKFIKKHTMKLFRLETLILAFFLTSIGSCSLRFREAITRRDYKQVETVRVDTIYDTTRVVIKENDTLKTRDLMIITKKDSNVITLTKIEKIPVKTYYKETIIRDTIKYYNHRTPAIRKEARPPKIVAIFEGASILIGLLILLVVILKVFRIVK